MCGCGRMLSPVLQTEVVDAAACFLHRYEGLKVPPPPAASKSLDVLQLGLGLLLQAVGLVLSSKLSSPSGAERPVWDAREAASAAKSGSAQAPHAPVLWAMHWGHLRCNVTACVLLLLLRAAEGSRSSGSRLLLAKVRASTCGAISVSGGLAPMVGGMIKRRQGAQAFLNLSLHVYVSLLTCVLLQQLTK